MQTLRAPTAGLHQILAADQRFGKVNPDNDHVWELTTHRGEPPAVALQSTLGLRANGLRLFPRFQQNQVAVTDPRSFFQSPSLEFSCSNFVAIRYSPFQGVDVSHKTWVPDSLTLVGEFSLVNSTDTTQSLGLEWVALLRPFSIGAPMSTTRISVNTVLSGQSHDLFPVFFLTGGPQANYSAYPSLGIDMVLQPRTSRQVSWALASLDSQEASFYTARKFTAFNLAHEQIRLEMLRNSERIEFQFEGEELTKKVQDSQDRVFQLLMPPFQNLNHTSFVHSRNPDERLTIEGADGSTGTAFETWGILDLWMLSRSLLPSHPGILREITQNLLDWQGEDGAIDINLSWNPRKTGLPAPPLLASLVTEIYCHLLDEMWLRQVYPALLRSFQVWFTPINDPDQDGVPVWRHPVQTGLYEVSREEESEENQLRFFVDHATWPSLAALLLQECACLLQIAAWIGVEEDKAWLEHRTSTLRTFLEKQWNEELGRFTLSDQTDHSTPGGKILKSTKRNGTFTKLALEFNPAYLQVDISHQHPRDRTIIVNLIGKLGRKSVHERLTFPPGFTGQVIVTTSRFSGLSDVEIAGLKRGDQVVLSTPDYSILYPDFLVPLWAGACSPARAEKMIDQHLALMMVNGGSYPVHLKIMWIESLLKNYRMAEASTFFQSWFGSSQHPGDPSVNHFTPSIKLDELTPILPLLGLLGIEKISENEVILNGFNQLFEKVNVQYKQLTLNLEERQSRIDLRSGESVVITAPGRHRVTLS